MRRVTAANVAAAAVVAVLIAGGAAKIYSYTSPLSETSQSAPPLCGYQDAGGQPFGCWSGDLGYLPQGYVPAPHYTNGPIFPCPPGMDASQCSHFQESCGNGICDPNETCGDCPIDCIPGQLVCNSYSGRADEAPTGSPVVCFVNVNATGG
jgi:hypothetical protein